MVSRSPSPVYRRSGKQDAEQSAPRRRSRSRSRSPPRRRSRSRSPPRRRSRSRSPPRRRSPARKQHSAPPRRPQSPNEHAADRAAHDAQRETAKAEQEPENWGAEAEAPAQKEEPNFGTTGLLTEDANMFRGVVLKYSQPPEARKPKERWRLYPFKGKEALDVIYIHRQSAYLIGRDPTIADIPCLHPSISKQHAVVQYRLITDKSSGRPVTEIKPYIIDLGSTNKTFLNGEPINAERFYELKEQDVLKFGLSSREYVAMKASESADV